MRKKKVSIITLQYVDNYGSVLQTFATEYMFRKAGAEPEIVDLTRDNWTFDAQLKDAMDSYHRRLGRLNNPLLDWFLRKTWTARYQTMHGAFDRFRDRYIHLSRNYAGGDDLQKDPPEADIYCSGSDQIWNLEYNGATYREYFLSYAPEGKVRAALSSSFGLTELSREQQEKVFPLLQKYDRISVREASALDLLREMGIKDGVHLLDPTLMLSGSEWQKEFSLENREKRPYVLVYQLNFNPEMLRFAKKLAKEKHLKVICITQIARVRLYGVDVRAACEVQEFLSLIQNAEYVITDSFHGTAFSLNFQRQFYIFYPPRYSTRLRSILEKTGTLHRVIGDPTAEIGKIMPVDYRKAGEILSEERKKAEDFIQEVMSLS